jgi:hypothetical protein
MILVDININFFIFSNKKCTQGFKSLNTSWHYSKRGKEVGYEKLFAITLLRKVSEGELKNDMDPLESGSQSERTLVEFAGWKTTTYTIRLMEDYSKGMVTKIGWDNDSEKDLRFARVYRIET